MTSGETELMLATLQQALDGSGLAPSERQYDQLGRFFAHLLAINQTMNLTRITDPAEAAIKHFCDSLLLCRHYAFADGATVADIGSGAGFPGIPLAIMRPDLQLTLVDSLRKRTQFLSEVLQLLGLTAVQVVHARAEDFSRNRRYRERYAVVTARAVAALDVLAELCLPAVRVGGMFLAMKGPRAADEYQAARRAIWLLGGGEAQLASFSLPLSDEQRSIVMIPKLRATPPAYPRKAGMPEKQPLK